MDGGPPGGALGRRGKSVDTLRTRARYVTERSTSRGRRSSRRLRSIPVDSAGAQHLVAQERPPRAALGASHRQEHRRARTGDTRSSGPPPPRPSPSAYHRPGTRRARSRESDGEVNRTSSRSRRRRVSRTCVRACARARLCHREEVPDAAGRAHVRGRIPEGGPGDRGRRGSATHLRG